MPTYGIWINKSTQRAMRHDVKSSRSTAWDASYEYVHYITFRFLFYSLTSRTHHDTVELIVTKNTGLPLSRAARGEFRGYIVPGPGLKGPERVQISAFSFDIVP